MADIITNIKNKVVQEAILRKILTEDEVNKYVGKYIDEFGFDSFVNYLAYLIKVPDIGDMDCFITFNQKMLLDKKGLEARFKLKILSPDKMWEGMQDELFGRI